MPEVKITSEMKNSLSNLTVDWTLQREVTVNLETGLKK